MSSFDSSKIAGQFLDLGLELGLNFGQSGALCLSTLELSVLFAELSLHLISSLLGSIQLGGVSSSS